MADAGHKATDKLLKKLEKDIAAEYKIAVNDMEAKLTAYMEKTEAQRKVQEGMLNAGKITQKEYSDWCYRHNMVGERWTAMRDTLAHDMTHANEIAKGIMEQRMPDVFALNANYATWQIESQGIDTGFTLYNHDTAAYLLGDQRQLMPKPSPRKAALIAANPDMQWNKQKIQSAVLQGVLQGESASEVAQRLQGVGQMNYNSAVRYARTMTTSAQNAGRYEAYRRAKRLGVDLTIEWEAILDHHTRHAHRQMHGQRTEVDEPFHTPDGYTIYYPADCTGASTAPQKEIWNCRCTLLSWVKGYEGDTVKESPALKDMSFEEWQDENAPKKQENVTKEAQKVVGSIGDLKEPQRPKRTDFDNEEDYYEARAAYKEEYKLYNEAVANAADESMSVGNFKSADDVKAWADKAGVTVTEDALRDIDIKAFNAATKTLDEMFERFPEAKSYLAENFDGTTFKTGFEVGTSNTGLLSANHGFNFNPRWFANAKDGISEGLRGLSDGFTVHGDGSFATLVRHEYGHNVQDYIETKLSDAYHMTPDNWRLNFKTFDEYVTTRDAYHKKRDEYTSDLIGLAGLEGSSEYSNTNTYELFAEGFAEWSSGGSTAFAKAFGEFIRKWY